MSKGLQFTTGSKKPAREPEEHKCAVCGSRMAFYGYDFGRVWDCQKHRPEKGRA